MDELSMGLTPPRHEVRCPLHLPLASQRGCWIRAVEAFNQVVPAKRVLEVTAPFALHAADAALLARCGDVVHVGELEKISEELNLTIGDALGMYDMFQAFHSPLLQTL